MRSNRAGDAIFDTKPIQIFTSYFLNKKQILIYTSWSSEWRVEWFESWFAYFAKESESSSLLSKHNQVIIRSQSGTFGMHKSRKARNLINQYVQSVVFVLLTLHSQGVFSQSTEELIAEQNTKDAKSRLQTMQTMMDSLYKNQRVLSKRLRDASEEDKATLEEEKASIEMEIKRLNQSFERVAIGGVSTELFGEKETDFNWKNEIILIVQPLIENLKVLTEKPRKIERLRNTIEQREDQKTAINDALKSIEHFSETDLSSDTKDRLDTLKERWQLRLESNKGALETAVIELVSLQREDTSWLELIKQSTDEFLIGRGLTLLLALAAAIVVWLSMRFFLWLLTLKVKGSEERRSLTRYRLAAYAYSLLTTMLVIIAVMVVFYIRGDVLLLGLSILLVAAIIIGLRNTLPKFIAETKLLLNLGAIREGERVIYNGVPWRVSSINLYSVLRNPHIDGSIRVPLSELTSLKSRPFGTEAWYPHRQGDLVIMPNGKLAEIIRISPELVELLYRGGASGMVATSDMYNLDAFNLSRNGTFGVTGIFGIAYEHQNIALTEVAEVFKQEILSRIRATENYSALVDISVDLRSAGASSIDFLIFIQMKSSAAKDYFKIGRVIQQSCIQACSIHNWNIPFPQMTVHAENFKIERLTSSAG